MSIRRCVPPSAHSLDPVRRTLLLPGAIGIFALASSGCSLLFVDTPPARTTSSHVKCTTSKLAPGLDTALGAFQVVRTGYAVGAPDSTYRDASLSRGADIGLGLGFTALFVGSAIYGFVNTGQCSRLKNRSDEPLEPDGFEQAETWTAAPASSTAKSALPERAGAPTAAASQLPAAPQPPATPPPPATPQPPAMP